MSDRSMGQGWWLASDGKWYPPESHPDAIAAQQQQNVDPNYNISSQQPQNHQFQNYQPQDPNSNFHNQTAFSQQGYGYTSQPPQMSQEYSSIYGNYHQSYGSASYGPGVSNESTKKLKSKKLNVTIVTVVLVIAIATTGILFLTNSSSSSPTDPVSTFLSGQLENNFSKTCQSMPPTDYNSCISYIKNSRGGRIVSLSGTAHTANFVVNGNLAIVAWVGTICETENGTKQCKSFTNPNSGLPSNGESFSATWNVDINPSAPLASFPCIEINGTWYIDYRALTASSTTNTKTAESILGNAIIEVAADYVQDNGQFGTNNSGDVLNELQQMDPSITFTTNPIDISNPNATNMVQIDACNSMSITNCQWIAMASFQLTTNTCYYVIVNKGSAIPANSPGGIWSGSAISSNQIPQGTFYASSSMTKQNSCNVYTQNVINAQVGGFP